MSIQDNLVAYPLSSKTGNTIPHDVVRPAGCFLKTSASANNPVRLNPADLERIQIISVDVALDSLVILNATTSINTDGELMDRACFLPAGSTTVLSVQNATHVQVMPAVQNAVGLIAVNLHYTWSATGQDVQLRTL